MIVIMLTCVRQVIIGRDRMSPGPALYQYIYIQARLSSPDTSIYKKNHPSKYPRNLHIFNMRPWPGLESVPPPAVCQLHLGPANIAELQTTNSRFNPFYPSIPHPSCSSQQDNEVRPMRLKIIEFEVGANFHFVLAEK